MSIPKHPQAAQKTPQTRKPNVCLAMIVKNEAHVIERCLESLVSHVDCIYIHDTGSTDNTMSIIQRWMDRWQIQGSVRNVKWKDFGYNRTLALNAAKDKADWTLMLDADEVLEGAIKDIDPNVHTYQMNVSLNGIKYRRNFLFNNKVNWRFEGVVHEYPVADIDGVNTQVMNNVRILSFHDGARSLDGDKYSKDAELLEAIEEKSPRDVFYLAQCYRDAGRIPYAMDMYAQRTTMGGWAQEIYYSYYMLGTLKGYDPYMLLRAYNMDPRRAEALLALGKYYMDNSMYHVARMYLQEANCSLAKDDMLFRDDKVYAWHAKMEYAVCEHYCGDFLSAKVENDYLLEYKTLPSDIRKQVERNLKFAQDAYDNR